MIVDFFVTDARVLLLFWCAASEPEIRLSGSNNGRPVVYGNSVRLECEPVGGIPFPTVSWGGQLPEGASTSTNGNTLVVTLDNIQKEACVQCIGTSLGGETREDLCVPVLGMFVHEKL